MKLIVVRHGESEGNVKGICSSKVVNSPCLTEKGKLQAKKVRDKLKDNFFDIVYTSRLLRTQETANYINQYHSKNILIDKRLDDRLTGFENFPVKDFYTFLENSNNYWNVKKNGGESFEEEKMRIFDFLDELKDENFNEVLIVSHMEPIQIFNIYFNEIINEEALKIEVANCNFQEFIF